MAQPFRRSLLMQRTPPNGKVPSNCFLCARPDTVDDLVGCERCDHWSHYSCANVTEDEINDPQVLWYCGHPCKDPTTDVLDQNNVQATLSQPSTIGSQSRFYGFNESLTGIGASNTATANTPTSTQQLQREQSQSNTNVPESCVLNSQNATENEGSTLLNKSRQQKTIAKTTTQNAPGQGGQWVSADEFFQSIARSSSLVPPGLEKQIVTAGKKLNQPPNIGNGCHNRDKRPQSVQSTSNSSNSSARRVQLSLALLKEEEELEKKFLKKKYDLLAKLGTSNAGSVISIENENPVSSWVNAQQRDEGTELKKVGRVPELIRGSIVEPVEPTTEHRPLDPAKIAQRVMGPCDRDEFLNNTFCGTDESFRTLTKEQIAARKVTPYKLPPFNGEPGSWPRFISSFQKSTRRCGYTNEENLERLAQCLSGDALASVKSSLTFPETVPAILDTLRMLFGRPEMIVESIEIRIRAHPSVEPERLDQFIKFALLVRELRDTIVATRLDDRLADPGLIQGLLNKLPVIMKMDWADHSCLMPNYNITTFADWIYQKAVRASAVTQIKPGELATSTDNKKIGNQRASGHKVTNKAKDFLSAAHVENNLSTFTSDDITTKKSGKPIEAKQTKSNDYKATCVLCEKVHSLSNCEKYVSLPRYKRWEIIKEKRLCGRCLGPHYFKSCQSKAVCGINECSRRHHPSLHENPKPQSEEKSHSKKEVLATTSLNVQPGTDLEPVFRILPVKLYGKSTSCTTYAFFDEGSSLTLLEELDGPIDSLCLKWTGDTTRQEDNSRRVSLEISGNQEQSKKYSISDVRTVATLNLPVQSLNTEVLSREFDHLKGLPSQIYTQATPRILIGLRHYKLGLPLQVREGKWGEPIAEKTRLGWTIFGSFKNTESRVNEGHTYHICGCRPDEKLHRQVKEFFSLEHFGVNKPEKLLESREDTRAREILENTAKRIGKKFEIGLLWQNDFVQLPNSLPMAMRRLRCLETKMSKNPVLAENLRKQLRDYVTKGYVKKLSSEEAARISSRTWYLPIFAVVNPNKPGKVRIVWDAAAEVNGTSLNSVLMKGPDLYTSLPEVLFRFRQGKFAVTGDIREMFHQIGVTEQDREAQRFLWRDGDSERKPDVYEMCVMTFGATCSPCAALYIKNKNATTYIEEYPRAVQAILQNHYVDDYLDSFNSEEEALIVTKEVRFIHDQGGFEIRNWNSNSPVLLHALGERGPQNKNLNIGGSIDGSKVLGMWWNTEEDTFYFTINFNRIDPDILNGNRRPTKREVLRTLMMIFDPMGLIAFFLVQVKILLQEIWRSAIEWDATITDLQQRKWLKWTKHLSDIENIKIPRCYSHNALKTASDIQLHTFVDASENAFAAAAYLRIECVNRVECVLVAAKTKVAPQSPLSIPRMELQAAVLGTRLANTIVKTHSLKISSKVFWTDSANVMAWLRSDSRKYRQFVAFRIAEVLDTTEVNEWRWVPSKLNVADDATKWSDSLGIHSNNRWFKGPEFLLNSSEYWPVEIKAANVTTPPEEIRPQLSHVEVKWKPNSVPDPKLFEFWTSLVRTEAYILRFFHAAKNGGKMEKGEFTRQSWIEAEQEIFRQAQWDIYRKEILVLMEFPARAVDKASPIYKLSPFLDATRILRMRSRLSNSSAIKGTHDLIILPKDHLITNLIVKYFHKLYHHHNQETVVNEIRRKFAIPKLRVLVKQIRSQCQRCKNDSVIPVPPLMGDLPGARLATFTRPFSFVGVDYFGPLEVVIGRRIEKRWGVLYTCLTIRAIHLEIAYSLSTDSCIMCLRNFVARRGQPVEIFSDNGTNFRGTDNELRAEIKKMDQVKFVRKFSSMKWSFIPPGAPHMGGCWERLVRSVKTTLKYIMPDRRPNDETLRCSLMEVENIVNSRPLTYLPIEDGEEEMLTPNHFLLGTSNGEKPIGKFSDDVMIHRQNWKISQRIADHFWKRWVAEYLPVITRRTKWFSGVKPIEVGDVVVIAGENERGSWPLGIIQNTIPSRDGQVRRVIVKTAKGIYTRPATKIAVLDVRKESSSEFINRPPIPRIINPMKEEARKIKKSSNLNAKESKM